MKGGTYWIMSDEDDGLLISELKDVTREEAVKALEEEAKGWRDSELYLVRLIRTKRT